MTAKLIRQLQNAYSGEKAAYAYRGHALSVVDATEREQIRKIESEEWQHRQCIGEMLKELNVSPRLSREILMTLIGITIYCLCRIGGWLNFFNFGWYMSMYGAGKLEQGNIVEYQIAAQSALLCGHGKFVSELIQMAEVEWDHEFYYRSKAASSKWSKWIKTWEPPPARISTRKAIENFGRD